MFGTLQGDVSVRDAIPEAMQRRRFRRAAVCARTSRLEPHRNSGHRLTHPEGGTHGTNHRLVVDQGRHRRPPDRGAGFRLDARRSFPASPGPKTTETPASWRRTSSRRRTTPRRSTTSTRCRCRRTATPTPSPSRTARSRPPTPSGSARATSRSSPPTPASCSRTRSAHPVGRWCGAFDRLHYMCGFHNSSYSGGGQNPRGQYFALYAAY